MRLIDADALLNRIEVEPLTFDGGVDINELERIIKQQPTIEAEEADDLISRADAIKAICEDGTWLERQGCYEITMAERKQRDADILSDLPSAQPKIVNDSQEVSQDLISRADAIEIACGTLADGLMLNTLMLRLNSIPSAQPKQGEWIPCEERLPDIEQDVLATTTLFNISEVTFAWRINDGEWLIREGSSEAKDNDILAWMPLPQPYNGARMTERRESDNTDCQWK